MAQQLTAQLKIGFLGAGQLARMSSLQAFRFGLQVGVFSDRKGDEPVEFMTPHAVTGSFDSAEELSRFAQDCDILTLENEFIDASILREMRDNSGTPLYPSPETFALIEDKRIEKETFENAGIKVTPYAVVDNEDELEKFGNEHGWPYVLKSSKGGYDGYGNATVADLGEARKAFTDLGGDRGHEIVAEAFVDFTHELAVQVARNETGAVAYPCVQTIQQEGHINSAVRAPAPIPEHLQEETRNIALKAAEAIDGKGIFAFEFFLTEDEQILLNESAPRPHNSGHYTIEGCITSQFENHIRAILGLPLGSAELRRPSVVMVNLLGKHQRPAQVDHAKAAMKVRDGHLHVYGKLQSKIGRKMGHFTLLGDDPESTYQKAKAIQKQIEI